MIRVEKINFKKELINLATEKIITSFTKHMRDGVTRLSSTYNVITDGKVEESNNRFDSIIMSADKEVQEAIQTIEEYLNSKLSDF